MRLLMILILVGGFASYFGRANFAGELSMSFLPYWCGAFALGILRTGWEYYQSLKEKKQGNKSVFSLSFFGLQGIGFLILIGIFLMKFFNFYGHYQLSPESDGNLKVFYSNIYKGNNNYQELSNTLEQLDPDLAMFVEFEEHHYEHLKGFLKQKYPYIQYLPWSTSIIVSKYPIKLLPTSVSDAIWRYHYFQIEKDNKHYLAYLIHTSSPTTKRHFINRNAQLRKIAQDFLTLHEPSHEKDAKIFMIGDFNISPWSSYYETFAQQLSGKMENATRAFPIYFSRDLAKLLAISDTVPKLPSLLHAHIDQLMVSPSIKIKTLQGFQLSGSDHRGFSFSIE